MRVMLCLLLVGGGLYAGGSQDMWKPYQFKGNETFVYSLKQVENGKEKSGRYVIALSQEGDRTVMKLEGKLEDLEGSTTLKFKSGSGDQIQGQLMAQMFFNPWLAPLSLTLFAQGMMTAMITAMTAGAEEARHKFKSEEGTTEYVVEDCKFQEKKGRRYLVKRDGALVYESCVVPDIALPVYIKSVSDDGDVYEIKLEEYKEKK